MIEVELPDGRILEFPAGTSQEVMRGAIQRLMATEQPPASAAPPAALPADDLSALRDYVSSLPPVDASNPDLYASRGFQPDMTGGQPGLGLSGGGPTGGLLAQFGAGSQVGIARGLGFPVDAVTGGINALGGVTGLWGPIEDPFLGSSHIDSMIAPLRANVEAPQNVWERGIRRVGEEVGAGAAMMPLGLLAPGARAAPGAFLATDTASSVGAGVGAATANELFPGNPYADAIGALVGGIPAGYLTARQFDTAPIDTLRRQDVSVEDLQSQASALYDQARANGVTATPQQTQDLQGVIRQIATDEGLITPAGRVAESYPRVRDVLNMVDDFAAGSMDPTQMQAVRRTMQAAASSADGAERRIGTILLREFDNFVAPLAPEFAEASALYRRAMQGQTMDVARELAESRSGQFSGSGLENALRTEYRGLDRNIIRGRMRGLTDDQASAIQRVARGTPGSNLARAIGRAAPTGVVSVGLGGGMPFLIGNAFGGPALGTAAGAGTMAAGALGRAAATRMGLNNVEMAELLMRSATGQMPAQVRNPLGGIVAGLLAARTSTNLP